MPVYKRRMVILFWISIAAFAIVLIQLKDIQMVSNLSYAMQARKVRSDEVAMEEYERGEITDRNGISLTGGYYANRVVVFPVLMDNMEYELSELSDIAHVDLNSLIEKASQGPFYISRALNESEYKTIQRAGLTGIYLLPVYHRYGNNSLAVHVTGYLGKMSNTEQRESLQNQSNKKYAFDDWVGQSGLEYFYEKELKGSYPRRWARILVDARGRVVKGPGLLVDSSDSDPGRFNVVTTIDHKIQCVVEDIMDEKVNKGAVVVMQAGTGDVLAMSSRPDYDPNSVHNGPNVEKLSAGSFVNNGTSLFQPGSVFKVVLAAAALENGLVQQNTMFTCTGKMAKPVRCWKEDGHGSISFQEAFAVSCNPVFVEIGRQMGADTIIEYARALGLADQGIAGYPVKEFNRQNLSLVGEQYNLANSCVGQGPVLATPVQITAMLNTIASKGIFISPRLVAGLSDDKGNLVQKFTNPAPRRSIEPETAEQLQKLLREVTVNGEGQKAEVPGWGSAGKTGSAQVSNEKRLVNAWFTGYVPVDNPRYVITVLVCGGKSGGTTAAPLFKEIAVRILN